MSNTVSLKKIAIIGCGPSGLFMLKRLLENEALQNKVEVEIFEKQHCAGAGMPYSRLGANDEHVTNVSDNEIPTIITTVEEWLGTAPEELISRFHLDPDAFNEYKVLPRLLFGAYLRGQFDLLYQQALDQGLRVHLHIDTEIVDIKDLPETGKTEVLTAGRERFNFDFVVIATGHRWPVNQEGITAGWYDSPYPPAKLAKLFNHPVAIKGASLTAIDAIRTLSRHHGHFEKNNGRLKFCLNEQAPQFKIVMHSKSGLLPALRFHLEDSHLSNDSLLSRTEIENHIRENDGFLSLDYIFQKDFIEIFREKDPEFYEAIREMTIEEFVSYMMELRERLDPFVLLKAEYAEAEQSIKRKESVYWKEMLAILSFAINYPAKHLPAEDMLRLQKVLMPLISVVIAFIPQSSCLELLALHDAGLLELLAVGNDSEVEPMRSGGAVYHYTDEEGKTCSTGYKTFLDCVGQPHLNYEDFPFKSLVTDKTLSPAMLPFASAAAAKKEAENNPQVLQTSNENYWLKVSGISINDDFRVVDPYGAFNPRIFIMAVPFIGGYNPDYSGLDFCAEASSRISNAIRYSLDDLNA